MKKIGIFLLAVITLFTFSFGLTGCKDKDDRDVIKVNEVTHSIFYAPFYVAINNGYFTDEGIKIELSVGGGSDVSMTQLLSKNCDVALVGPETVVYVASQDKADMPVVFSQLTQKDGSFIVGKEANDDFSWSDMTGKRIIGGRPGGFPAMALEYALNQNGLFNGDNITIIDDVDFDNITNSFLTSSAEFMTSFEPIASTVQSEGKGYILASVGEAAGDIPFTAFAALNSYLTKNKDLAHKFIRAVMRGYEFIMNSNIDSIVDALMPSFATTRREIVTYAAQSYINISAWSANPAMSKDSFDRLIAVIDNAGKLKDDVTMNQVVDNTYANYVMQNMM